jgi:hypothetical protein
MNVVLIALAIILSLVSIGISIRNKVREKRIRIKQPLFSHYYEEKLIGLSEKEKYSKLVIDNLPYTVAIIKELLNDSNAYIIKKTHFETNTFQEAKQIETIEKINIFGELLASISNYIPVFVTSTVKAIDTEDENENIEYHTGLLRDATLIIVAEELIKQSKKMGCGLLVDEITHTDKIFLLWEFDDTSDLYTHKKHCINAKWSSYYYKPQIIPDASMIHHITVPHDLENYLKDRKSFFLRARIEKTGF